MTSDQKAIAESGSTKEVIKVGYTAKTHTLGGRRGGVSRSDDGRLARIMHVLRDTKSLFMVQSRCLGGFETKKRLSLERA